MDWPIHYGKALVLLCTLGMVPITQANERFDFSGFASFGIAKSLERDETYGGGSSNNIPYKTEFRDYNTLGLRMTADLDDNLKFTTQMLAQGRNDFDPEFDWIFLSYNLNPNLVLHVGKYVTSYFMYSDYADISYAYQWVSAPDAIYGTNINKTLEGAKIVWNSRLAGGWTSELSVMIGQDESDISRANLKTTMYMDNAIGFSWQLDRDWLSLRAGYMTSNTTADLTETDLAFVVDMAALLNDNRLNDKLAWDDDRAEFLGLGGSLHFDHVFVIAEMSYSRIKEALPLGDQFAGYITVGTYVHPTTSIALTLYQRLKNVNDDTLKAYRDAVATYGSDPAQLLPEMNGNNTGDLLTATQKGKQEGLTLSIRWDFHSNAALKAEYLVEQKNTYGADKDNTSPQALRFGVDLMF